MRRLSSTGESTFGAVNTGLSHEELAGTVYNAYRNASVGAGSNLPPWQDLGEGHQEGWTKVILELDGAFSDGQEVSWLTLARAAHQAYGEPAGTFETEAPAVKLCWVAAVRHLANVIDWQTDDGDPLEKHEMHWQQWTAKQLAKDFVLQEGEKAA